MTARKFVMGLLMTGVNMAILTRIPQVRAIVLGA